MRTYFNIIDGLNKLFPRTKVEGRGNTLEYSKAEYGWAQKDYERYKDILPLENKIVLDAGCGLGGRTVYYSEQGAESIVGIDIDENHIKFSKEFAAYKKVKNVSFMVANFIDIPLESNKFDVIILNDVLEHIKMEYLEKALLELKRVLKPGGTLLLEFPPWTSPFAAHLYDHISIPWCQYLFPERVLIKYVESKIPEDRFGKLSPVEHFKELNKLKRRGFIKLMQRVNLVELHFQRRIIKNLNFLKVVPILNDFVTNRIVAAYTKRKTD